MEMCWQPAGGSSLRIGWADVLDLDVRDRNDLIRLMNERYEAEEKELERARQQARGKRRGA